ncbi:MAG: hypothetical protein ACOY93_11645 [Bacillota bacterium]
MPESQDVIARLRELKSKYEAALGEGAGEPPGFIEDAMVSLRSYDLVAEGALETREVTLKELQEAGLPPHLEHPDQPTE